MHLLVYFFLRFHYNYSTFSRSVNEVHRDRAVSCLVLLFVEKFTKTPYAHSVHLYRLLVKLTRDKDPFTRAKVLFCLLNLRANSDYFMQLRVNRNSPATAKSSSATDGNENPLEGFVLLPSSKKDAPKDPSSRSKSSFEASGLLGEYDLTTSPYLCCWEKGAVSPLKSGLSSSVGSLPSLTSLAAAANAPLSPPTERKEPGRVGVLHISMLFEALIDGLQYESVHEVHTYVPTIRLSTLTLFSSSMK